MAKKKQLTERDPLRLMRWANEGFGPIDLNASVSDVVKLTEEIKRLRRDTEEITKLRRIAQQAKKCCQEFDDPNTASFEFKRLENLLSTVKL